jgi:hypothetical protein
MHLTQSGTPSRSHPQQHNGGQHLQCRPPQTPHLTGQASGDKIKVEVNSKLANAINLSSGCTNPTNLDATALIDTTASVSLLTPQAPANNAITTDVKTTIIQPSEANMTSTNTVDLLLQALPPQTRLAHRLPGLINNLLSVAVLCDAGCKVFFHRHGCEVTLEGTTIIRGWRDPQNRLWCVKILDDGWTTNITLCDEAKRPAIALSTPPTAFAPTTTHTDSLYECSKTNHLINFYYTCFNYPTVSSLTKAINCGYMK